MTGRTERKAPTGKPETRQRTSRSSTISSVAAAVGVSPTVITKGVRAGRLTAFGFDDRGRLTVPDHDAAVAEVLADRAAPPKLGRPPARASAAVDVRELAWRRRCLAACNEAAVELESLREQLIESPSHLEALARLDAHLLELDALLADGCRGPEL